ncbi:MAG: replication initiation protein [Campylobacterota bacterium]|nr:replication initiation protein [Campylobacterota bacterium]
MIEVESLKLINAKYKLTKKEIDFLILSMQNMNGSAIKLDIKEFDLKFIKKMMMKTLEISLNDESVLLNWFSKIKCVENSSDFYITLQEDVKKFLFELKNDLSSSDLKYFFTLSSNYSRAIYKLLKVHQHKSRAVINIEDLKRKLQVPRGLQTYSNFKMKVINVTQQELKESSNICFTIDEKKDGKKVTSLIFNIYSIDEFKKLNIEDNKNSLSDNLEVEIVESENKKQLIPQQNSNDFNANIKRVVSLFDHERKKIQPNYSRKEYGNIDGEYQLRVHMKETNRTPEMFFDAIRWLFSKNPQASFHRQYVMNIGKLIEHFNTLEHQAMYSQEAVKFNEEAQSWYNIYKKQGLAEKEILEKLKEGGYLK